MQDRTPAPTLGSPPPPKRDECCATCGGSRYCAPGRCYCGHEACPAFASYIDIANVPLPTAPATKKSARSSWDDREGATWIDQL